jgi:hypothetical protein
MIWILGEMFGHEQIIPNFPVVEENVFGKFILEILLFLGLDDVDEGGEDFVGFEKRVCRGCFALCLVREDLEGFLVLFVNLLEFEVVFGVRGAVVMMEGLILVVGVTGGAGVVLATFGDEECAEVVENGLFLLEFGALSFVGDAGEVAAGDTIFGGL